ncbi:MAG: aminotransferase class I/II-fold pyridoxal phosphate-dependent enzyme [Actinomycetaceae bacterium]|nr:aminotransferase class I/II-fold pyridoxal phosphate-dependent enzyme [Actinomycetaceae bacterium]
MLDKYFDFDTITPRRNTWSAKWDLLAAPLGDQAVSLSVADMEYMTSPAIRQAMKKAAEHGIYGYTEVFDDFSAACSGWLERRHGWSVESQDIIFFPRVIEFIACYVNFIAPQCKVVTMAPRYSPIMEVIERAGCAITEVDLLQDEQGYTIDFSALEKEFVHADLFLWCSPHNPTGRVWTKEESIAILDLARRYKVTVISDDVHADFVRTHAAHPYIPLPVLGKDLYEKGHLIVCVSPGKTFNTAGLEVAAICCGNKELGKTIVSAKRRAGLHNPHYFAIPTAIAAWNDSDEWVDALLCQIDERIDQACHELQTHCHNWKVYRPEGTYLLWIETPYMSQSDLEAMVAKTQVALSLGEDFGAGYERFFRLNVAVPHKMLTEGLQRLVSYYKENETLKGNKDNVN